MASTAPAHALLAGAGYILVGKAWLPSLMSALGCLGWIAQAGAVLVILRRALGPRGASFVALGIALGAAWSHRFVALETNLVAACVLWAVAAALESRWSWTAGLLALAGLLRPDAYLVALPLGIACVLELRGAAWRPALLGAALSAPWYLFAAVYYGSVLPTSLSVKYATVDLASQAQRIASYLGDNFFTAKVQLEFEASLRLASDPPGPVAALSWLVAATGGWLLVRRQPALWVLVACPLLYVAAYLVLRMEIGFEWHLYPALLFVTILILSAIALAVEALPSGRAGRIVGSALLAAVATAFLLRTAHYARVHERAFWLGGRDAVYRDLADYLVAHSRPRDVVAASEVGSLAYYSELHMLDLLRLATPQPRLARQQLGPRVRWFIDIPVYSGRPLPNAVHTASSEPLHPDEPFPPGRDRFTAAVLPWSALPREADSKSRPTREP